MFYGVNTNKKRGCFKSSIAIGYLLIVEILEAFK